MKNMRSPFWIVLQALLLISTLAQAQPEKAEAGIKAIMQEIPVMGLSVAVVKNNKIIYKYLLKEGISEVKGGINVLYDMNYPKEIIENTLKQD